MQASVCTFPSGRSDKQFLHEKTKEDDVKNPEDGYPLTAQTVEISRGNAEVYAQI